jgi:hypothetical protein
MKPRISVLGTGHMRSALVVDIWNLTKSRSDPLAALGAGIAAMVQNTVAASEIVVVPESQLS